MERAIHLKIMMSLGLGLVQQDVVGATPRDWFCEWLEEIPAGCRRGCPVDYISVSSPIS